MNTGSMDSWGNQVQAFKSLESTAQQQIIKQGITGVFESTVTVSGTQIIVHGTVIDGVVKIGTAFIP